MAYPIGTPGVPWGAVEKQQWYQQQQVKRSYQALVVQQVQALAEQFAEQLQLVQYGELDYATGRYPLYALQSRTPNPALPTAVVTGGIHGYETSGVMGALAFVPVAVAEYLHDYNIVVVPCVSPWGFETINRWNPQAVDPNRSFKRPSPAPEAGLLMDYIEQHHPQVLVHIDLHETTDTDNSEFRPALAARDAIPQSRWDIPDGYYSVADSGNSQPEFHRAIIESVAKVTHIAEADAQGCLIGAPVTQFGVIEYPVAELGLCAGLTSAQYVCTTEVYPDSARTNPAECTAAQVAAVRGGLDYLRGRRL